MNDIDISLKIISEPREVATTATSTVLKIDVVAPPASYNKVETVLTLDVYGKQKELFSAATEGALKLQNFLVPSCSLYGPITNTSAMFKGSPLPITMTLRIE